MTRFLSLAVLAVLAVSARAQMGDPCVMTEITRLCGQPNGPDFKDCASTKFAVAMQTCRGASKEGAAKAKSTSPCTEDMKKYCPGIWPGPELHECMSKHMGDVTPECAAYGKTMMAKHGKDKPMEAGDAACMADAKKLCPALTGLDGGELMDCMVSHEKELSPSCRKKFGSRKSAGKDLGCAASIKKLCPDASFGSPEMSACMVEHKDELPASCDKLKGKKR